jgi:hypothetical protein
MVEGMVWYGMVEGMLLAKMKGICKVWVEEKLTVWSQGMAIP